MINMKYKVLINKDENGVFVAECLNLPGCISDGYSKSQAIQNIKEAIIAYNESIKKEEKNSKKEIIEVIV